MKGTFVCNHCKQEFPSWQRPLLSPFRGPLCKTCLAIAKKIKNKRERK